MSDFVMFSSARGWMKGHMSFDGVIVGMLDLKYKTWALLICLYLLYLSIYLSIYDLY